MNKVIKNQNMGNGNSDDFLSKDEISYFKKLYKQRTSFDKDLEFEYNNLPPRKPNKNTNYIISNETFEEFEVFSNKVADTKRITRDDLVEMALRKFMMGFK